MLFIWIVSGTALIANSVRTRELNGDVVSKSSFAKRLKVSLILFASGTVAFFLLWMRPIDRILLVANRAFVYWRAMNLTSGASPIVPFLSLAVGLYFWFWYALHGLALFGPDRPCLPPLETLGVKLPIPGSAEHPKELKLSMFSQQTVAEPAERMAKPLSPDNIKVMLTLFAVLAAMMFGLGHGVPVRNLGAMRASRYTLIFCLALIFYCSLILTEASQIWRTWSSARQLLVFLDRMALRRTLCRHSTDSRGALCGR